MKDSGLVSIIMLSSANSGRINRKRGETRNVRHHSSNVVSSEWVRSEFVVVRSMADVAEEYNETFIRHPGIGPFRPFSIQNYQKSGVLAIALRKIVLRLLTKVTGHSRAGMQRKIQKLKNNGSKYDKYQIFFVSLHTK